MTAAYYEDDYVRLFHGDYRAFVGELIPGSFACVVTDPPYGDTSLAWDRSPARGWLECVRPLVARHGSVWFFGSLRYILALAPEMADWRLAQDVVWEKHNGSSFHADRFKRVHEMAVQLYRDDVKWEDVYKNPVFVNEATKRTLRRKGRPAHMGNIGAASYASEDGGPKLQRSVIFARSMHGTAIHPTQKPAAIVQPLIEYSCPPTGRVLDIFAGSGTTLEVARSLGIKAVGFEIDEAHCESAASRLSQQHLGLA